MYRLGRAAAGALLAAAAAVSLSGSVRCENCADDPRQCNRPVKFIGDEDGCACFRCEADTDKEKRICTRDEKGKKLLFALIRDTP